MNKILLHLHEKWQQAINLRKRLKIQKVLHHQSSSSCCLCCLSTSSDSIHLWLECLPSLVLPEPDSCFVSSDSWNRRQSFTHTGCLWKSAQWHRRTWGIQSCWGLCRETSPIRLLPTVWPSEHPSPCPVYSGHTPRTSGSCSSLRSGWCSSLRRANVLRQLLNSPPIQPLRHTHLSEPGQSDWGTRMQTCRRSRKPGCFLRRVFKKRKKLTKRNNHVWFYV